MFSPRHALPIAKPRAPARLDDSAAAQLGLVERGPARAKGLVDRYGRGHRTLRISVTERCNLRCRYCMPAEGVALLPHSEILNFDEIERLARLFVGLGIERIRLTGGEPLVRKNFTQLASRIGALKQQENSGSERVLRELLITTNGLLLEPMLPALIDAGLDGLNISIDTLRADRFEAVTRRGGFAETISAVRAAARTPGLHVKVNAVALRGLNEDELCQLADFFAGELGIELRFIEYMPFEGNHWSERELFPASEIRSELSQRFQLEALGLDQSGIGTAQRYTLRDRHSGARLRGSVGIISSMSEPFCGTCSRLRLTADGQLRWCLLDEGEADLRGPLRAGATDGELAQIIEGALGRKAAGHEPAAALLAKQSNPGSRSMIRIGG